ncbi:ABC transporter ATP-binding protein [Luteimonas sp. SJ-92]|uniref:ABC transporter ATP-binding protein n=1 Tax=Luteimonas salinisoli TaxID=2752307 RepID=A0A853JAG9_9GAMM|nr:ABC transporter ATP-binding protein [Luteimonas salinisoli]NZA25667.1 ABC transporter ATP-binding protein [Luteimonas salinisoli]
MVHAITLDSVSHHFQTATDRIVLFEDVSLDIQAGRSYSIAGPSGAGKSSLLTLVAGLETPKAGRIEFTIDNRIASQTTLRKRSGFIFQQFHLLPELDALSNLALPLRLKGDKNAYDKAHAWLARVGLTARARHKPAQLSGGEQQRVAIARAFIGDPVFVFADEPTGNLDEKTAEHVAELMFDFGRTDQRALVLVTHNRALAAKADHRFRMAAGELERLP